MTEDPTVPWRLVTVDVDGTLTNCDHRRPLVSNGRKDWKQFHALAGEDTPNHQIIDIVNGLYLLGWTIYLTTARPADSRAMTESWMLHYKVDYHKMFMRHRWDNGPDHLVKFAMLQSFPKKPDLAIDDRNTVVQMWRNHGILTLQVAEGDF